MRISRKAGVLAVMLTALFGTAALAEDGQVIITQDSVLAGNVTPGDAPGYPITITAPGSYKLGSNLQAAADRNGIVITAQNVTLDMNGFTLFGQKGALNGIKIVPNGDYAENVAISNGSIRDFKLTGINGQYSSDVALDNVRVLRNDGFGVYVMAWVRISNSNISQNGNDGIYCMAYCVITSNVVSGNHGNGMFINDGSIVGNEVNANYGYGIESWMAAAANNSLWNNKGSSVGQQVSGYLFAMDPNYCQGGCTYADPLKYTLTVRPSKGLPGKPSAVLPGGAVPR